MPLVSNLDCRSSSLQSIARNLVRLNQFCQQHKIKLYVFEVPRKEVIYKEIIRNKYGFDEKQFVKVSRVQGTIRNEARKHHISYIYPYRALRDAVKSDFVFFKCSHHWTDWGAFIGYCELMKAVQKDFPDTPVVSLNDYQKSRNYLYRDDYFRDYRFPRHFSQFFNDKHLDNSSNRTLYNYYDHKKSNNMVIKVGKFAKEFAYPAGKHKIMLLGTSQNENLLQFLPYSAGQTKFIRLNAGLIKASDEFKILKLYKKDIITFEPNILILSIHTDDLPRLRDLCSTK